MTEHIPTMPVTTGRGDEGDARSSGFLLVVDDDALIVRTLTRLLRFGGYKALGSTNAREAIDLVDSRPIDLVILDVLMPEMSGLEVLRELRRRYSLAELPIIMATGLGSDDHVVEALELGANDYLVKPVDPRLAFARINAQLELKRSRDEIHALNRRLTEVQAQVGRLMSTSSKALDDVAAWARSVAPDVASTVGVDEIGVWAVEENLQTILVESSLPSPLLVELACVVQGQPHERGGETIVPAIGFSGQLAAVLVVPGTEAIWSDVGVPVLDAFAHQLGAALELRGATESRPPPPADETGSPRLPAEAIAFVQICPLCGACHDGSRLTCRLCGPSALLRAFWTVPYLIADRYRLESSLGSGGMATVFSAHDERLDREVAVKVIRPDYSGDELIRARFEKEARAVARIADPGVVAVHDCGEIEGGSFFIVMDRLHGSELATLVERRGPGTPQQVARLLRQAAPAVDAAHRARIVHRDIKPSNLFLVPQEGGFQTKILDFGVAKRFDADEQLTGEGLVVGTPLYMSPEQANGASVGYQSDIYSLAAVGYYALTGHRLSTERAWGKVLLDVIHRPPPRLSNVMPEAPEELDSAFRAAMAKRPADRPETATAWVDSFVETLEAMAPTGIGWF